MGISEIGQVRLIGDKARKSRLHWSEHVQQTVARSIKNWMLKMELLSKRKRGRLKEVYGGGEGEHGVGGREGRRCKEQEKMETDGPLRGSLTAIRGKKVRDKKLIYVKYLSFLSVHTT